MPDTATTYEDVLVLHATDLGWLCRIGTVQVFLAKLEIEPGTFMPCEGERGPVAIAGSAAERVRKTLRP